MPGLRCAVALCRSKSETTEGGKKVSFYRFPKEKQYRKLWEQKCKRADKNLKLENARICSYHFTEDDYERNLRAELLNIPARRKLKKSAVPSRNLTSSITSAAPPKSERQKRVEKRQQKQIVKDLLKTQETVTTQEDCNRNLPDTTKDKPATSKPAEDVPQPSSTEDPLCSSTPTPCIAKTLSVLEPTVLIPMKEYQSLLSKCEALSKENESLKKELQQCRRTVPIEKKDLVQFNGKNISIQKSLNPQKTSNRVILIQYKTG